MSPKNKPIIPIEVPSLPKNPELNPSTIPEAPLPPEENPESIPEENPLVSPPNELPPPGEKL